MLCALLVASVAARADTPLDLGPFQGRVVYLDFWASWCVPCRQSFPWMRTLQGSYEHQGLAIVAVNLDEQRADAQRFLERYHPGFEVRFDPAGETAQRFHVAGMPTSVLIDRHGAVRYTHTGFRPADAVTLEAQVRELLAEH